MVHKPKAQPKAKQPELPLDDRRWLPGGGVHKRLVLRTGDPDLASIDLTEVVCKGEVRVSRRNIRSGEREHVLPTYFADLCMVGGEIVRRFDFEKRRDWAFYVWGPDITKRWPELKRAADDDDDDASTTERRKPGKKIKANWKVHVAGELHRVVVIEGKPAPTATKLADHCQTKTGYRPDESTVQKLLRTLLD